MVVALLLAALLAQQPPAPQPFPRPGTSQPARPAQPPPAKPDQPRTTEPAAPPLVPGATSASNTAPSEISLGVPIYPGAQFIKSYDAGRGQRFYLFGSTSSFVDLVTYYRTTLRQKGDLVLDVPATHEFLAGKFRVEI